MFHAPSGPGFAAGPSFSSTGRPFGVPTPRPPLTARQRDVLRLIGEDLTIPQIAALLQLERHTVARHRRAISARLGVAPSRLRAIAHPTLVATVTEPATHEHNWSYGFREDWRPLGGFAECVGPTGCGFVLR